MNPKIDASSTLVLYIDKQKFWELASSSVFFFCENPKTPLKGRDGPEVTEQKDSLNSCMGPEAESEAILAGLATTDFLQGPYKFGTDNTTPRK